MESAITITVYSGKPTWIDLQPAQQISPYDQVAAFSVSSEVTEDLNVSAFLPRDLLEWNFGISEPHRVKAGLLDNNSTLYFINGSGAEDPDALTTGGGFTRILHEGYEPDIYFDPYATLVEQIHLVKMNLPSINSETMNRT